MRSAGCLIVAAVLLTPFVLSPNVGSGHPGHSVRVWVSQPQFSPARVTVIRGDAIGWVWDGPDTNHSVTADPGQAEQFDSDPDVAPLAVSHAYGDAFVHAFSIAGRFSYHCKVHPFMRGTVTVRDPYPPYLTADLTPETFCAGADCLRPRYRIFVNEPAILHVSIQRREGGRWRVERELSAAPMRAGFNSRVLPTNGLATGVHRLAAYAVDPSGNRSITRRIRFEVLQRT